MLPISQETHWLMLKGDCDSKFQKFHLFVKRF